MPLYHPFIPVDRHTHCNALPSSGGRRGTKGGRVCVSRERENRGGKGDEGRDEEILDQTKMRSDI